MPAIEAQSGVRNLTSTELRDHMKAHRESDYVLIDVRQAEEYQAGHIAGALHMPLSEIESRSEELKRLSGRDLVFYCRSGARSARASAWVSAVLGMPRVMNLLGGFSGWQGPGLTDFPRLAALDSNGSVESLLLRALDLEKGTYRLYVLLSSEYQSGIIGETLSSLVNAEMAHAGQVYRLLAVAKPSLDTSFEQLFDESPGNLIEGGMPFEVLLARAKKSGAVGEALLLELALEIELSAYDLYKSIAFLTAPEQSKQSLLDLAQQEKAHADMVLGAIARLATASAGG